VKRFVIAVMCALLTGGGAGAAVVDAAAGHVPVNAAPQHALRAPLQGDLSARDLQTLRRVEVIGPISGMSELPEPEVFLMMLVGLCLIGYRASRDSDEKFS
jgi:hypothetical protein